MSSLFMSAYILSLCLYLCTRASGGLILVAHQASKSLCPVCFSLRLISSTWTLCYVAWQLIRTVQFVILTSWEEKWVLFKVERYLLCILFTPLCLLFVAGCLASLPGERAALLKTCVTCLQRWTPSSQPWPLSTLSTKSCWDHTYVDERA